jgi:hypothetical protein
VDEELPGHRDVDAGDGDTAPGDDGQSVDGDLLGGHRGAALTIPRRFAVAVPGQVLAQALDPCRVDAGHGPGPQSVRLDQLAGHHPVRRVLGEHRSRGDHETGLSRADELASTAPRPLVRPGAPAGAPGGTSLVGGVLHTDVREQPAQQRQVDDVGLGPDRVGRDAELLGRPSQLLVDVLPLADAVVVEELVATHPAELVRRAFATLFTDVVPQVDVAEEVAVGVREARVQLVRLGALVEGALTRILDRHAGDDDHDLVQAAVLGGLEHHAAQPGVDGQTHELPAQRGEPLPGADAVGVDGAELLEQGDAVADVAVVRRVDEGERRHVAEPQVGHLQDDRGQVGPTDLGLGELGPCGEVVLVVEADRDARTHAPAAAGSLVGGRLRDLLDREALHLGARRVPRDAGGARVDDGADAGHGERRLCDVGGQHDASTRVPLEHPVLFGRRQPCEQGEHLGVAQLEVLERRGGVTDLALAGAEHQDVAVDLAAQLLDGAADAVDLIDGALIDGAPFARRVVERSVADLDGERAPLHLDDRRVVEVLAEPGRVDRRRGDDHLEVGAPGKELSQVAEQEVDVERPLVCLVDDDRVVRRQRAVALDLREQDAVGHHLDARVGTDLVVEPDLVPDRPADLGAELLGHALGDRPGRDAAGLGVADPTASAGRGARRAAAGLEAELGQLRALARTRLAGDDQHLVVADRRDEIVAAFADREIRGVGEGPFHDRTRLRRAVVRDAPPPDPRPGGRIPGGVRSGVARRRSRGPRRSTGTGPSPRSARRRRRRP